MNIELLQKIVIHLFLLRMITDYLYKLFKNINECDIPFTMENVLYVRKIALYVLLYGWFVSLPISFYEEIIFYNDMLCFFLFFIFCASFCIVVPMVPTQNVL